MFSEEKMAKCKDLNYLDKGQFVMARPLGYNISNTTGLMGCFKDAVFSSYQKYHSPRKGNSESSKRVVDAQCSLILLGSKC